MNSQEYRIQLSKGYIDENGINWEQRRYEIVKEILPSLLKTSFGAKTRSEDNNLLVSYAIELADVLVEKLKGRAYNTEKKQKENLENI